MRLRFTGKSNRHNHDIIPCMFIVYFKLSYHYSRNSFEFPEFFGV